MSFKLRGWSTAGLVAHVDRAQLRSMDGPNVVLEPGLFLFGRTSRSWIARSPPSACSFSLLVRRGPLLVLHRPDRRTSIDTSSAYLSDEYAIFASRLSGGGPVGVFAV